MTRAPSAHLAVYLNDHLAGGAAALEMVEALAHHQDASLVEFATILRSDVEQDRDELLRLMRGAGVETSRVRRAVGWLSEKTARLKLAVDDPVDGRLHTYEMLEALALGIEGKRALWAALQALSPLIPELRGGDYRRLMQRADDQRAAVELRRLGWAAVAFASPPREP